MFEPVQIAPLFSDLTYPQLWLGYSGGLDSHVLLQSIIELIDNRQIPVNKTQLHAVHINHGWSQQASAWSKHCQQICADLTIDYHSIIINAKPTGGQGPEACARAARYNALATFINKNDLLLTAHQQDDQAETLLLQLLRGAGVKGLASMPLLTSFANGWHLRPLLNFSRADLLIYATQKKLNWIEDASNADTRYTRNFLRHAILPVLKQRWPTVNAAIARVAGHCAEADQLLDEIGQADLITVQGTTPQTLSCRALLQLSEIRQKNVLRHWLTQSDVAMPSAKQLQHIVQDVLHSKKDTCPQIALTHKTIRRYQNNLYVINKEALLTPAAHYHWNLAEPLAIPFVGTITAKLTAGPGLHANIIQQGQLSIRFRQAGERCQPVGRQGSHPLKKLFQEWQVPPWKRHQVPLVYCGDQLVAVAGYCLCEPFVTNKNGWVIRLI